MKCHYCGNEFFSRVPRPGFWSAAIGARQEHVKCTQCGTEQTATAPVVKRPPLWKRLLGRG